MGRNPLCNGPEPILTRKSPVRGFPCGKPAEMGLKMTLLEGLVGVGVLVLLAIWGQLARIARDQKRAADWLQFMAKPKGSGALED